MAHPLFNDLTNPDAWQPVASGEAELRIGRDQDAAVAVEMFLRGLRDFVRAPA